MGGFTTDAARSHESCVLLRGILSEGSLGILIFSHDCLQVDEQEPGGAWFGIHMLRMRKALDGIRLSGAACALSVFLLTISSCR